MPAAKEGRLAARAIWKGVIVIGKAKLPVKLYSAVHEHTVHFRLLHKTDHAPVQQRMVEPDSGEAVEAKEIQKAWPVGRHQLVMLEDSELESIEPKPSRDIKVTRFVSTGAIDHRWYERPYLLGPDGSDKGDYFAIAEALRSKEKEGVARWVMRKKEYVGSLREESGYLVLIALRHAEEVIDVDSLPKPQGRPLQKREIAMAEKLIDTLSGTFDPEQFRDEYHDRVMDLINAKAHGRKPKIQKFHPRKTREDALEKTLEASLAAAGRRSVA